MASYSGFLRKAPRARLKTFLEAKGVELPEDFDWNSAGRGKAFISDLNAVIDELPDRLQDRLKAELDHLSSLTNEAVMISAEQVCPTMGIDLEGFEGVQDVLLMLAVDYPQAFERVAVQASLNRRTGGRNWSAFQFDDEGTAWALEDDEARVAFVGDAGLECRRDTTNRSGERGPSGRRTVKTHRRATEPSWPALTIVAF
ncbi:MAG: hypothetical protein ABJK59_05530 [Erythrobacter sp.]|uniref:hypothetical protein n=1 Tax=Erythrobacter sp. TaxID=1042 RepID=UPI003298C77E